MNSESGNAVICKLIQAVQELTNSADRKLIRLNKDWTHPVYLSSIGVILLLLLLLSSLYLASVGVLLLRLLLFSSCFLGFFPIFSFSFASSFTSFSCSLSRPHAFRVNVFFFFPLLYLCSVGILLLRLLLLFLSSTSPLFFGFYRFLLFPGISPSSRILLNLLLASPSFSFSLSSLSLPFFLLLSSSCFLVFSCFLGFFNVLLRSAASSFRVFCLDLVLFASSSSSFLQLWQLLWRISCVLFRPRLFRPYLSAIWLLVPWPRYHLTGRCSTSVNRRYRVVFSSSPFGIWSLVWSGLVWSGLVWSGLVWSSFRPHIFGNLATFRPSFLVKLTILVRIFVIAFRRSGLFWSSFSSSCFRQSVLWLAFHLTGGSSFRLHLSVIWSLVWSGNFLPSCFWQFGRW